MAGENANIGISPALFHEQQFWGGDTWLEKIIKRTKALYKKQKRQYRKHRKRLILRRRQLTQPKARSLSLLTLMCWLLLVLFWLLSWSWCLSSRRYKPTAGTKLRTGVTVLARTKTPVALLVWNMTQTLKWTPITWALTWQQQTLVDHSGINHLLKKWLLVWSVTSVRNQGSIVNWCSTVLVWTKTCQTTRLLRSATAAQVKLSGSHSGTVPAVKNWPSSLSPKMGTGAILVSKWTIWNTSWKLVKVTTWLLAVSLNLARALTIWLWSLWNASSAQVTP